MQTTTTSQKIRIGLFTVIGLLLLVAGIFLIGRQKSLFTTTYHMYGTFHNIGGLQIGNNVRFSGITAGTVEEITILNDSTVRVDMRIQSKYQPYIKEDAIASIGSDGLMGDKLVTITPGNVSNTPLKDGGRVTTTEPMDMDKMLSQFTAVANNATVITGALATMATDIQNGRGTIGRLMSNEQLAIGLEGTLANTQRITNSLADLSTQIQAGKGSLGQLVYTDNLSRDIHGVMTSADSALATVQVAAYNFSENMKALQGNYFLRGYFRRKNKAAEESKSDGEDTGEMSNDELEDVRRSADQELKRRSPGSDTIQATPNSRKRNWLLPGKRRKTTTGQTQ